MAQRSAHEKMRECDNKLLIRKIPVGTCRRLQSSKLKISKLKPKIFIDFLTKQMFLEFTYQKNSILKKQHRTDVRAL